MFWHPPPHNVSGLEFRGLAYLIPNYGFISCKGKRSARSRPSSTYWNDGTARTVDILLLCHTTFSTSGAPRVWPPDQIHQDALNLLKTHFKNSTQTHWINSEGCMRTVLGDDPDLCSSWKVLCLMHLGEPL